MPSKTKLDASFTERVIAATGPKADARMAEIMPSLVRHLHSFAREVGLTVAEYVMATHLLNECGRLSNEKENHTQLLTDILGLETLVDDITSSLAADGGGEAGTPSAILGPFYRAGAPSVAYGGSIVRQPKKRPDQEDGYVTDAAYFRGRVLASDTGKPLRGAVLDVWEAAPNGFYDQQDPEQVEWNMRGRVSTDDEGRYAFYGLRPISYPIQLEGPTGRVLTLLDRDCHRPGHVHFMVTAPARRTLVTQIFDARDAHLGHDVVFADKEELVVKFKPRVGDDKARWELEYDFSLVPACADDK